MITSKRMIRPVADRRTVVCQITRGLAPAPAIAAAMEGALMFGLDYHLISGLKLVEAKNAAVAVALAARANLILIEDDVIVPFNHWPIERDKTVWVATAVCHNGAENTKFTGDGHVLLSGTVFVSIPRTVIFDLTGNGTQPLFRARKIRRDGDRLGDGGGADDDQGSDSWFFYLLQMHGHRAKVCGRAYTIKHDLTRAGPSTLTVLP